MRNNSFILILLFIHISCSTNQKESKNQIDKPSSELSHTEDSISLESASNVESLKETVNGNDSVIYINQLTKFYNHKDYYIPLYFKESYNESTYKELVDNVGDVVFSDNEMTRRILSDKLANKYLNTSNLDDLIVFSPSQDIVDTLKRKQFEFLDDMIESLFISTYTGNLEKSDYYLAIPLKGTVKEQIIKSPKTFKDSTLINRITDKNRLNQEELYSSASFVSYSDTLSILSFVNYQKSEEHIYLFKNEILTDSLPHDFVFNDLLPIPFSSKYEYTYLAECGVPDTDMLWNSVIGIDLTEFKIKFYEGNKFTLKEPMTTEEDCIFDNNYYGLTSQWIKELGFPIFSWDVNRKAAKVDYSNNDLYLSQGGCEHFGYSINLELENPELKLDSVDAWKKLSIDLADRLNFDQISRTLKNNEYTIQTKTENGFWFDIKDDNEEDNFYYTGVQISKSDEGYNIGIGVYYN